MKVIFLFPDNLWLTLEINHIPRENNLINFKNLEAKSFDCNEDFNDFKISKNENKKIDMSTMSIGNILLKEFHKLWSF